MRRAGLTAEYAENAERFVVFWEILGGLRVLRGYFVRPYGAITAR